MSKTNLMLGQKRRESHRNLPCKITQSKCVTIQPERPPGSKPLRALDGKEVLYLVDNDVIRELVVPGPKPNVYPGMVETGEYGRLKQQARVFTKQDRIRLLEAEEAAKNKQIQECMMRKDEVKKWEKRREKGKRLTDLELDAKRKTEHLKKRALELQQENEEEVKHANRLILGTKCHAIRDAQVAEKRLMQQELEEEDRRLDQMMEDQRRQALLDEEERQEKEKVKKAVFISQVMDQIKENEIGKLLESEKTAEEARRINLTNLEVQMEELESVKRKAKLQEKMREELNFMNDQMKYFQELAKEETRISDLKVQEFMRQKAEREAAREEEEKQARLAKEREIARLRAMQERMNDLQAEMDEQNAHRIQDEVEREWRRKEKAEAQRKMQEQADLKAAREAQVMDRRRTQALEIAREKRDFERVLGVQRQAAEMDRLKELQRMNAMDAHREAILQQINEKEGERIKERQELFEEGVALRLEKERRDRDLADVMKRKIGELKAYKVPEVYIKEIERQLKINED